MSPEEIEQLADRIAAVLSRGNWLPVPVRPEGNRASVANLPVWAGAAQSLGDVAPGANGNVQTGGTRHRAAYGAVVASSRGAAAGRGPSPLPGNPESRTGVGRGMQTTVAVSNRHIHICRGKLEALFGAGADLHVDRMITQPGQFAATERVDVVGPRGSIPGVRIVGPLRDHTQVELAPSDCRTLGIEAPVRDSGAVGRSAGVRLEGPNGSIDLTQGAIVAARHFHLSPADSERFNLKDGDRVSVRIGEGARVATLHELLVRCGPTHATEVHIDVDEANALGVRSGDTVTIIGRPSKARVFAGGPRRLVTERDVSAIARRGEQITDCGAYIVTPAARDRARALGIWRD